MFKVSDKDTRTTSVTFPSVIGDFELVNICRNSSSTKKITKQEIFVFGEVYPVQPKFFIRKKIVTS